MLQRKIKEERELGCNFKQPHQGWLLSMRILEEECPRWKATAKTLRCVRACCTPGSEVQIGSEDARNERGAGRCIGDDVGGGGQIVYGPTSDCRDLVFHLERAEKPSEGSKLRLTLADV